MEALMVIKTAAMALLAATVVFTGASYRRDLAKARQRLASYETKTVQTRHGKTTFIDKGEGTPLLVVHGICGGYDQAYETLSPALRGQGFRVIAPSRFGYPGTDLPKDSTPRAQADAFKDLLDQLGVDKAVVIATSAGGGPGLRFAQQYPARTKGLILISANVPTPPVDYKNPPDFIYNDFPMWAAVKANKGFFLKMFGIDPKAYANAPYTEKEGMENLFDAMLPMGPRNAGIMNDNRTTNPDTSVHYDEYDLGHLGVPVLFVHARNDPMAKFPGVEAAFKRIPGARMSAFDSGGHPIFGHGKEVDKALLSFIGELE